MIAFNEIPFENISTEDQEKVKKLCDELIAGRNVQDYCGAAHVNMLETEEVKQIQTERMKQAPTHNLETFFLFRCCVCMQRILFSVSMVLRIGES